jgi:hypothetical protein
VTATDEIAEGHESWGLIGFANWSVEAVALPRPDDTDLSNGKCADLAELRWLREPKIILLPLKLF